MGSCARCTAPAGGVTLCTGCIVGLRVELADVAGLLPDNHGKGHRLLSLPEDLTVTLSRQDHLTDTEPIGGTGDIPLIFKSHAGEALWILDNVLREWATELGDTRTRSPRGLAVWMLTKLERIQKHPDAGQLADEVTDAIHQARRAIDRPTDDRVFLGRCGAHTQGHHECREELYGSTWGSHAQCPRCGTDYTITQRQDWLRARQDHYQGTVSQVAGFLRATGIACTTEQVRGYARSRHGHPPRLTPAGTNHRGHATYLIADVLAAVKERYVRRTRGLKAGKSPGKHG